MPKSILGRVMSFLLPHYRAKSTGKRT